MNFDRSHTPRETLRIGNPHLDTITKLIKSYKELPFVFEPNKRLGEDIIIGKLWRYSANLVGTFFLNNEFKHYIKLEYCYSNHTYSIISYCMGNFENTWDIREFYNYESWQSFMKLATIKEKT